MYVLLVWQFLAKIQIPVLDHTPYSTVMHQLVRYITIQTYVGNSYELNMLHDSENMEEYLHLRESEKRLSESEFDIDNELDDHALLDAVVNYGSVNHNFVWENMQNYKGQRENFMGSV
jgi:hypothetical protein